MAHPATQVRFYPCRYGGVGTSTTPEGAFRLRRDGSPVYTAAWVTHLARFAFMATADICARLGAVSAPQLAATLPTEVLTLTLTRTLTLIG